MGPIERPDIPTKYRQLSTSGLTVTPGGNTLNANLHP